MYILILQVLKFKSDDYTIIGKLAWTKFLQGNIEESLNIIQNTIKDNPNVGINLYYAGRIYWELGDEYRLNKKYVFTYFAKAIKNDTSISDAFTYLGYYYGLVNEKMKEIKSYIKCLSIDPSNEGSGRALSLYYYNSHNYDKLVELYKILLFRFENAITIDPRAEWAFDLYSQYTYLTV